jgi:hypothetical protein
MNKAIFRGTRILYLLQRRYYSRIRRIRALQEVRSVRRRIQSRSDNFRCISSDLIQGLCRDHARWVEAFGMQVLRSLRHG